MRKWVYNFRIGNAEGSAKEKNLLGGKGANLAEMCALGLPVPPGFTISTEACISYYAENKHFPKDLMEQVTKGVKSLEEQLNKEFGKGQRPLLVSVRSGARASMPGMMDTVLNLGLNDITVESLATQTNNPRFAYDSYRRFIQMFSDVVLGIDAHNFEEILEQKKRECKVKYDYELTSENLQELIAEYKERVEFESGEEFPQDPHAQLDSAIKAVFNSWMNDRAKTYRKLNNIPEEWGTAVNIQSMVFGNLSENSATGVAFTRNPSTGERKFYGEYLLNAQGEDVVAGIRTPQQITIEGKKENESDLPSMEEVMPKVYLQLVDFYKKLETHYRDMQDIEFTIEEGVLYILQTRSGKRTAKAALKIAVDLVQEGLISKEEAILRIEPESLDQLLHPTLDAKFKVEVITKGLPASPGAASGYIAFTADDAEKMAAKNKPVILTRIETSPEDIHGMHASKGILTARGGMTSHAAVVARGMGKTCVTAAANIDIDYKNKTLTIGKYVFTEDDMITINGTTGEVIRGSVPTVDPELNDDFKTLMEWADEFRTIQVRTNAETGTDVKVALKFGAEGIGLCRTEHMFFEEDRIIAVRQMIVSNTSEDREKALEKILPMQRQDFVEIFELMSGLPVNIRLLDPPLHEFLPHTESEMQQVAKAAHITLDEVKRRSAQLVEINPMLGHRGCRLGISYPEIYRMQSRAIFEAAASIISAGEASPEIEVMVPLIMSKAELSIIKADIVAIAENISEEYNVKINYMIGTMIELPRAALLAHEIAEEAEYFSFGTNDLTQTTLGLSRDDSANFIEHYKQKKILRTDPFVELDIEGVGELVAIACERGRKTRPNIKIGICGEHGGNPASIAFFQKLGLDYVSCSPFRVPIARLAVAQSSIRLRAKKLEAA